MPIPGLKLKLTESQLDDLFKKHDLAYFAEKILNMEIVEHHQSWAKAVSENNKINILSSRDSGKSFFFSFAYVIWRLYYNWIPPLPSEDFKSLPRSSLGYIFSSSEKKAIEFLDLVKIEIESNPKLRFLLPAKRDSWSKTEIRCSNGAVVRARGWGAAVRGGHPVWMVCDDVLSDENIYSEVTRMKSIDYFYSAITPMVIPGGQLIVVGTPFHASDLYGDIWINPEYYCSRHPAIKEDGKALWPTRYSLEMLRKREVEVGSIRFAREYLVQPVSEGSSLFPERILKENYDTELSLVTDMTDSMHNEYTVYTGVDLALSAAVGADYTVIMTVGVDQYKNIRILDMRRFKGRSMTEQLHEIEDVYHNYRPTRIYIEDNQFQKVFRDELVANTDLPVEGYTTTARNKNSLEKGIPSLQVRFENRKWIIPRKTERDRRLMDILINELKCFTWQNGKLQGVGSHDDCVMALWIAYEACQSSGFSFSFG